MPTKPKRPCAKPGCRELTTERYCAEHKRVQAAEYDSRRGTAHSRGYNHKWRKARSSYLAKNPLCAECQREGILAAATVVDHIVPHKGDSKLFWDKTNWQALCKLHHDRKTAREDSNFTGWNRGVKS